MTNKKATRYFSSIQEERVAKLIGGKVQSNSGATRFQKGDVVTDDWLIECKTTTTPQKSVSIKKEWIKKNQEEAMSMRKPYHAIAVDFGSGEDQFLIGVREMQILIEASKTWED